MEINILERAELQECLLRFARQSGERGSEVMRRVRELQLELAKESDEHSDGETN